MTWTEAEEICRRDGGHLAFALSTDHLAWLSSLTDGSRFWIGRNDFLDPFAISKIIISSHRSPL